MPDEEIKLLTLDRWGASNLDKWWKKNWMNSSSGRGKREKWSRSRAGKMEGREEEDIEEALVPARITGRD